MPMPVTMASDQMLAPTATAPSTCALTCPASTASTTLLPIAASCAQIRGSARRTVAPTSWTKRTRSGWRKFMGCSRLRSRSFYPSGGPHLHTGAVVIEPGVASQERRGRSSTQTQVDTAASRRTNSKTGPWYAPRVAPLRTPPNPCPRSGVNRAGRWARFAYPAQQPSTSQRKTRQPPPHRAKGAYPPTTAPCRQRRGNELRRHSQATWKCGFAQHQ